MLSTLTPSRLTKFDYVNLSGVHSLHVSFLLSTKTRHMRYLLGGNIAFPAYARGFFYFGPQPGLPSLATSIRFRCTQTSDPSSFAAGFDLRRTDGLPWQILLAKVAISPSPVFRDQLIHEGHLTPDSVAEWHRRLAGCRDLSARYTLFTLRQPFPLHFPHLKRRLKLTVIGEEKAFTFWPAIGDYFGGGNDIAQADPRLPGAALVHFERSRGTSHLVHLRIVKLLIPWKVSTPGTAVLKGAGSWQPARPIIQHCSASLLSAYFRLSAFTSESDATLPFAFDTPKRPAHACTRASSAALPAARGSTPISREPRLTALLPSVPGATAFMPHLEGIDDSTR
ncbi:hypothetical protein DFH07DRAFT_967230 [Mycena maculata]|uniref:Uncharacterized protein n=1 Tax=Mycena maculata TaxID=230809 RepID=A0AAD7MWR3_9AGAR|nr:hypothetical protein DFH07DRAFT_967230 [Mycena maculata]